MNKNDEKHLEQLQVEVKPPLNKEVRIGIYNYYVGDKRMNTFTSI